MKSFYVVLSSVKAALLGLVLTTSALANPNEIVERNEVQQFAINLFYQQQWQELDSLFTKYNQVPYPATSGGAQKSLLSISSFYDGFIADPKGAEESADQWIAAAPSSTAAIVVKATALNARASKLRGTGPANSVNPAIIPQYEALLAKAVSFLVDNKKIADSDPNWYAQIVLLSKLQGNNEARWKWLREGSERFPHYQNIYLEAVVGALPKWGGSPEEIEKISRLAVERTKDKTGMMLYTYLWYNAASEQPELTALILQNKIVSWQDMRQGWEDRLKLYPGDWARNGFLSSACLAGDKKTYNEQRRLFAGSQNVVNTLWIAGTSFNDCERRMR